MPSPSGTVGATSALADGALINPRFGRMQDMIVSELHGRYYEAKKRRRLSPVSRPASRAPPFSTTRRATRKTW